MPERSLRVVKTDKTFFNKISNSLSRLLIPTRISFNNVLITLKRNNLIKAFEAVSQDNLDDSKKDLLQSKYEEAYTLYLESIDKFVMDSVYKKVKNNTASPFERDSLSKYYMIVQLKDSEYTEYKHKKQKFLLELDYDIVKNTKKEKLLNRFDNLYVKKMDVLYKGILKNYSVRLSDGYKKKNSMQSDVYQDIFDTLEEYVINILPIKKKSDTENLYAKIDDEYDEVEKFSVGKLDEKDYIERNMLLLAISRQLFTHSLPLVAVEQCYNQLIDNSRNLIINAKNDKKKEEAYQVLLKLIKEYNLNLLSSKVYWEKQDEKEQYKNIWDKYNDNCSEQEKEIICIKSDLAQVRKLDIDTTKIQNFYKAKLVDYGVMRQLKNSIKALASAKYIKNKVGAK